METQLPFDVTARAAPRPLIGGRYRLIAELGRGGFGVVHRAFDERLSREVALKLFTHAVGSDAPDRARFEREAVILASLDHPGIVPVYDVGIDGTTPWFAMKLVRGGSLANRISAEPVPLREALLLLGQLAAALGHAHGKGVLHRDLKPSNVLCDGEGHVWLADFGVSSAGFLPRLTQQGTVIGTLIYLAPEALSGETSHQSDLYALGAILYEMLFGEPCFRQSEIGKLVQAISQQIPPRLSDPGSLNVDTRTLLQALLAKSSGERPPSAAAVGAEAERIAASLHSTSAGAFTTGTARAGEPLFDPAEKIEQIEREASEVTRCCEPGSRDLDAVVVPLLRFVRQSVSLATALTRRHDIDDGVRLALALSLVHMAREVERQLSQNGVLSDPTSLFSPPLFRLQRSVVVPLSGLIDDLRRQPAGDDSDFFRFDDGVSEGESDPDWLTNLRSTDELTRYEAIVQIGGRDLDPFIETITRDRALRNELLEIVWSQADAFLLEARGRSRRLFEAAIRLGADRTLATRWEQLYTILQKGGASVDDVNRIVSAYGRSDRGVFGRCLLLHPDSGMRDAALELVEPHDVWEVITSSSTSVSRLSEIWRGLHRRGGKDFQKIFLACVRDTLSQPGDAQRIVEVTDLVKQFYEADVFHEDVYFRMLEELDEWVRAEARRHHLLVDFDTDYVARLRQFLSSGLRQEHAIESWGGVPLPIQRRLARGGHFIRHFACHPVEAIAMECLAHIVSMGDGLSFASMPAIQGRLLAEMAKDRRLWMTDEARFALVANPKSPPPIVLKYIGYLRKDFLRKLADSRECTAIARTTAERMLARRGS